MARNQVFANITSTKAIFLFFSAVIGMMLLQAAFSGTLKSRTLFWYSNVY